MDNVVIRCINIELILMTYCRLMDLWMIRYIMNVMTDSEALLDDYSDINQLDRIQNVEVLLEERYEEF